MSEEAVAGTSQKAFLKKLAGLTCPRCQTNNTMQCPTDMLQERTYCGVCQTEFQLVANPHGEGEFPIGLVGKRAVTS